MALDAAPVRLCLAAVGHVPRRQTCVFLLIPLLEKRCIPDRGAPVEQRLPQDDLTPFQRKAGTKVYFSPRFTLAFFRVICYK